VVGFEHLQSRLPIGREVRAKPNQSRLPQMTAHPEAQQHAWLGLLDVNSDRCQARLVFEQRRFDLALELVRG
jgi:hypothetical protein